MATACGRIALDNWAIAAIVVLAVVTWRYGKRKKAYAGNKGILAVFVFVGALIGIVYLGGGCEGENCEERCAHYAGIDYIACLRDCERQDYPEYDPRF